MRRPACLVMLLALLFSPAFAADETVRLTFEVAVPASTPEGDKIFLVGDAETLGAWRPKGVELQSIDGVYRAEVVVPAGQELSFKLTRGSWETVEKSATGEEIANRTYRAERDETVKLTVAAWADQSAAPSRRSTLTGEVRVHADFHSEHLNNDRRLLVWLPPGYARGEEKKYPVLYMHDGQNVFDDATSFAGEWRADETADRLIRSGEIQPIIIVAIENNAARIDEYTLSRDELRNAGGRGRDYLKFVAEEVKPFIDRTYRTQSDRLHTAVAGSSLGGTISLELCHAYPETFGACAAMSPALWWNDSELLTRFEREPDRLKNHRFWVDTGTAEGDGRQAEAYVENVRKLETLLKRADLQAGEDYVVRVIDGAQHNERAWSERFDDVLRFLFPPK